MHNEQGPSVNGNRGRREEAYWRALDSCAQVARDEFDFANDAFQHATKIGLQLRTAVRRAVRRESRDGTAIEDARAHLQELEATLERTLAASLSSGQAALIAKRAALDRFTVTLFGRTMAGKSTIREALTGGDGSTIGKGAQRTTRDVREYNWNSLRLIDTPGIGAYDGREDHIHAMSVIEETDLVLFLISSDGLQQDVFEGMRELRGQNKPLLFVLNVKQDLSKPVNLRRFLKSPSAVLNTAELGGHFDRIRQLAGEQLEMRNVRIIPIHAQAAYLSTRPEHQEYAEILAEHCGLGDLFNELESHVSRCGTVRRLQTIIDGTQNRLLDLQVDAAKQAKDLSRAARRLEEKFGELDVWLDGFVRATRVGATTEAAKFVQPLRSSVSYFIDENIERDDVGERWTRKVKAMDAEGWLKRRQQVILDELHARLVEFSREMLIESEIIGAFDAARPSHFDPWDVKRTLRWTSAATGAMASVAAIAGYLSAASFWNPVGWIAGGISVIALGLSWCFDDREKKLQSQKAKTAGQLRDSVDKLEQELAGCLIEWFNDNVSKRLLGAIRRDTKRLYVSMQELSRMLDSGARQIGAVVEALNRRLLLRVGQFSGAPIEQDRILRVVRDPGMRSKFLWRDQGDLAFCRQVGLAIGERVDGVPDGPVAHRVAWSLRPASVAAEQVSVSAEAAVVRLSRHEIGRAKGRGGINVSLASRLMHIRIRIIDEARNAIG